MEFPARFQLIAAMNPSPAGILTTSSVPAPIRVLRYLGKLSGPFLDRFDLTVEIPLLPKGSLSQKKPNVVKAVPILKRA